MRPGISLLLPVLLLAAGFGAGVPLASSSTFSLKAAAAEPWDQVEELFREWDSTRSPGCALGVEEPGGLRHLRAWGMADLEHGIANSPSTVFEAGSISKQFTAAAVMLLVLEGRISLDDDIRSYIPEVPNHGEAIRVRHLVHHISGLRDWGSVAAISGWGRGDRTHRHAHVLEIVARQSSANFPPAFEYSYSNTGYNLLSILVERVAGIPFAQFSRERIFEPLGLKRTEWRDDHTRIVPGRSSAYAPAAEGGHVIDRPIEDVHGNGGLLTTVEDLLNWDAALRRGRLAGLPLVELMHEVGVLSSGRPIHYAAGLQIGELDGVREVAHTGSTAGYRAFLGRYPDQEVAVALLCNTGGANPGSLGRAVARIFLQAAGVEHLADSELGDTDPDVLPRVPAEALRTLPGLYRNERTDAPFRILREGEGLRVEDGPALIPLTAGEFGLEGSSRRLRIQGGAPAGRALFRLYEEDWPLDLHLPVEPFEPGPGELEDYQGHFVSADAETALQIRVEDGVLTAFRRPDAQFTLSPIYPDAFQAPSLGRVVFIRGEDGRIHGLSIQQARVYDMRFQREGDR